MSRAARWVAREVVTGLAAPITNCAADGFECAAAGVTAGRRAWVGGVGVHDAYAGKPLVGGEWSHGGADRRNALAQLGIDTQAFYDDLTRVAVADADVHWITTNVAPALAEWHNFVARMAASQLASYVTKWSVFEGWWQRLHRLRDEARARGITLTSPDPIPLPKTIWQRGADGTGSNFDAWVSLGRKSVFGAMTVIGLVGLYSMIRRLRGDLRSMTSKHS